MSIMASDTGGGSFEPVPQGTHLAVCNMVVDLGLQDTEYQGVHSNKHQVYIRWETPQERITWQDDTGEHEGPRVVGKTYTLSLSEKANLRKDLEAWRGRSFTPEELQGFDLLNILGQPCQITVTHREANGKTYSNVTGVAGIPKGMDKPTAENQLIAYSRDDPSQYDVLPDWLKTKISEQVDSDQPPAHLDEAPPAELDDDIPF